MGVPNNIVSSFQPFQSFQYPLPWSECPTEIEPVTNVSIVNEECKVRRITMWMIFYRSN